MESDRDSEAHATRESERGKSEELRGGKFDVHETSYLEFKV